MAALNPSHVWPTPLDSHQTQTSEDQIETEESIQELFQIYRKSNHAHARAKTASAASPNPIPTLARSSHLSFVSKVLNPLPSGYITMDSNRSWLLYWVLHSHDLLSVSLDTKMRARAIRTLLSFQNKESGGFGGGPGQISHLMSTYAAVSALAIVGGKGKSPTEEEAEVGGGSQLSGGGWDDIDRPKMLSWILSLKQPDGSYLVHKGGEVDVRASYCVMCITLLLGICTPQVVEGMGDFIAGCQTYEGGLAAACHSAYLPSNLSQTQLVSKPPKAPLGEAHGGYTFCGSAAHLALRLLPNPSTYLSFTSTSTNGSSSNTSAAGPLDTSTLLRHCTSLQGAPIEGGGMRGRTNKLVDGCYGWFAGGGMFSVLESTLEVDGWDENEPEEVWRRREEMELESSSDNKESQTKTSGEETGKVDSENGWSTEEEEDSDDIRDDPSLFDRLSLQLYVLIAAQNTTGSGGLRDKPGKRPDAYHTCYNLSGMSLAQHIVRPSRSITQTFRSEFDKSRAPATKLNGDSDPNLDKLDEWRKECHSTTLGYMPLSKHTIIPGFTPGTIGTDPSQSQAERDKVGRANSLLPTHPVLNVTFGRVKTMADWSYGVA